jgi:hypothetical protein
MFQKFGFFGLIGSRRTFVEKEQNKGSAGSGDRDADEAGRGVLNGNRRISNVPRKMREFNDSSKVSRRLLVSS